jgi:fatty acid desaturase
MLSCSAPRVKDTLSWGFLVVLTTNSVLIVMAPWPLPFRLVQALIQGLLLVGVLEAVHQATHENLFRQRWANKWVGTALASLLMLHFVHYRFFHAYHHAHTATSNDPERALYQGSTVGAATAWLLAPWSYLQFSLTVMRDRHVSERHAAACRTNTVILLTFVATVVGLTAIWSEDVMLTYWLPLVLFAWFDYPLNQAEHYGMTVIPEGASPAAVTNDLILPTLFCWMFLFRNYHRVHHLAPRTPWHNARKIFLQGSGPQFNFDEFLAQYFKKGPRFWGER